VYLSDVVRPNRRQILSKDLKFQPNALSSVSPVAVSDIEECLLLAQKHPVSVYEKFTTQMIKQERIRHWTSR
jgi:hypothetical protein